MIMSFGKYLGKSVDLLVLKEADYVFWLLGQEGSSGQTVDVQEEMRRLIRIFDSKPLVATCANDGCNNVATVATAYFRSPHLSWWCQGCSPGPGYGKIATVRSYFEVVRHAFTSCNGRRDDVRRLVLELAHAKGLPQRVGEPHARVFFHSE